MKTWLFIFCLIVASCAAQTPAPPSPTPAPDSQKKEDKYMNIVDANNKVVAEVNGTTGKVTYLTSPENAFEVLLGAHVALLRKIQEQQQAAAGNVAKPAPKKVVKKPEPPKQEKK
jgi:hypothetical protein